MYIAVISDLHLGARPTTDAFGHDDGEFLRFLSYLERAFDRIVLLGDIWETLTTELPGQPMQEYRAARAAHPELARRFEGKKYRYVYGNHDWIAQRAGASQQILLRDGSTRMLFTHGHQHDWLWHRARALAELGVWFGGWLRRLRLGAVYRAASRIDGLFTGWSASGPSSTFQRWAIHTAARWDADVVVAGHTHIAERALHGDRLYLNSGSCCGGQFSYTAIDTRATRFETRETW